MPIPKPIMKRAAMNMGMSTDPVIIAAPTIEMIQPSWMLRFRPSFSELHMLNTQPMAPPAA